MPHHPFDPAMVAADVEAKRRDGRIKEARDKLHYYLPYAPRDPSLCFAGGVFYASLGYGREAVRFFEVVEKSGHPLAKEATARLHVLAAEGTERSRDVAVCVLSLAEVYRTAMTPYARQWRFDHWERATLADPCWVLAKEHLHGRISGGHAAPPGHPYAWWTVRYAIEALEPSAVAVALGNRFGPRDVLVFLETETAGLDWSEPTIEQRLGTMCPDKPTALERISGPIDVARLQRVYVAGRVGERDLL